MQKGVYDPSLVGHEKIEVWIYFIPEKVIGEPVLRIFDCRVIFQGEYLVVSTVDGAFTTHRPIPLSVIREFTMKKANPFPLGKTKG